MESLELNTWICLTEKKERSGSDQAQKYVFKLWIIKKGGGKEEISLE